MYINSILEHIKHMGESTLMPCLLPKFLDNKVLEYHGLYLYVTTIL